MEYNEEISQKAYRKIWIHLIEPIIDGYRKLYYPLNVDEKAYEIIYNNYTDFKNHTRTCYMENPKGLLDRHKVCACLIYSIVKSSVISQNISSNIDSQKYSTINEDLALTVGLSLLRAFVISSIQDSKLKHDEKENLKKKYENGFSFPQSNHGEYRKNFLSELHYTKLESNYNILSLSQSLFLLETYTKIV